MKQVFSNPCSYLIDTMVYDQSTFAGPPRSVPVDEIKTLFGKSCAESQHHQQNTDRALPSRWLLCCWNSSDCGQEWRHFIQQERQNPVRTRRVLRDYLAVDSLRFFKQYPIVTPHMQIQKWWIHNFLQQSAILVKIVNNRDRLRI